MGALPTELPSLRYTLSYFEVATRPARLNTVVGIRAPLEKEYVYQSIEGTLSWMDAITLKSTLRTKSGRPEPSLLALHRAWSPALTSHWQYPATI